MAIKNQSFLQTLKILFLCSFSFLSLFLGFYTNYWRVADQKTFDYGQWSMEELVIGRIVKSAQDGILSSGGLLGVVSLNATTEDWGNMDFVYTNKAFIHSLPFISYSTYNSEIGVQGMFYGLLNKLITLSPQKKLQFFYAITSMLSAIVLTAIILWFHLEFGLTVAVFVVFSVVFSQWLTGFGRNLYWSLWAFYLPMVVIMFYFRSRRNTVDIKPFIFGIVVLITVSIKCLFNGYEFITTTLVMMTVPFVYYGILNRLNIRKFFTGFFTAAFSSCLAILLSFLILCFQIGSVKGSLVDGVDHIVYSLQKRTYANPDDFPSVYTASLKSGTIPVIVKYLKGTFFDGNNYISSSNRFVHNYLLNIRYSYLILLFIIMSGILYFLRKSRVAEKEKQKKLALIFSTWFSILAPLSWFIIFKSHSYMHMTMNYIQWNMPFIFFGFAIFGLAIKNLLYKPDTNR
jgi:hypothetical protein